IFFICSSCCYSLHPSPHSSPTRRSSDLPSEFVAFSPERLFTPLGQPVTDITFFVPGTSVPAAVSSFGAMFTDVDSPNTTLVELLDRKSTRLNSSHDQISYAVFCLKKKIS